MNALAEEVRREVLAAHVGTEDEVLLETPLSETLFTGYTRLYIPVVVSAPRPQERRDRSRQAGRVRWRARPCSTLLKSSLILVRPVLFANSLTYLRFSLFSRRPVYVKMKLDIWDGAPVAAVRYQPARSKSKFRLPQSSAAAGCFLFLNKERLE